MNLKKKQILHTKFTTDDFFQHTEYYTYFGRINYSEDYIRYFKDSVHGGGCIELNFKNYDPIDEDFQIFYYFIQTSKLEEFKEKFPPYKSHEVIINVKNKEEKEIVECKYDVGKFKFFDNKFTIIKSNLTGRLYSYLCHLNQEDIIKIWVFLYIMLGFVSFFIEINYSSLLISTLISAFLGLIKIISRETSTKI